MDIPTLQLMVESAISEHEKNPTRDSRAALRLAIQRLTAAEYSRGSQDSQQAAADRLDGMVATHGRANQPGLWLAAITLDPSKGF